MIPECRTREIGLMRFLMLCAAIPVLWLAAGLMSGCSEPKSELGTSLEFRKAELASQEAMRAYYESESQNKVKSKVRARAKPKAR
jgi:hypothetical protein